MDDSGKEMGASYAINFFGLPLDVDENASSIEEKRETILSPCGSVPKDPWEGVMDFLRPQLPHGAFHEWGRLPVESWLLPFPDPEDLPRLTVENFVRFIDSDGCRTYARMVEGFLRERLTNGVPCLLGVDHSSTGGVVRVLTEKYGPENISVIFLDSHVDALPMEISCRMIEYDLEQNRNSFYDSLDPYIKGRVNSYNSGSFIKYMIDEDVILPSQTMIVGISDYPTRKMARILDDRVKGYVSVYSDLIRRGIRLVRKNELRTKPGRLRSILQRIDSPLIYVSIDMDIGARNGAPAVRFQNYSGLSENEIIRIIRTIKAELLVKKKKKLVGLDIQEINCRQAHRDNGQTYRLAATLILELFS